eukprot:PRCOL_00004514-RA
MAATEVEVEEAPSDAEVGAEEAADAAAAEEEETLEAKLRALLDAEAVDADAIVELATSAAAGAEEALAAAEKATADKDDMNNQYLRLQADFDNFRKRTARDKEMIATKAKGDIIDGLLPTIDTFEQAKGMVNTESEEAAKVNDSYQSVYKGLLASMEKFGLEVVKTDGVQFDPETMEAIMRQPTDEMEDNAVFQEFRKGFSLDGTLLRPAMVAVAVNEAAPAAGEGAAAEAEIAVEEADGSAPK